MISRCLRKVTKLGLRLGVATGIGFGVYRLIESGRNRSQSHSDGGRHGDSASPPVRPDTMPKPADRAGAQSSTSPARSTSSEPETPDPPLVEPDMLTSVKGLRPRDPIASVGFGSGSDGGATNGSGTAGVTPAPDSSPDGPPAQRARAEKSPATKKIGPAKKPSASRGKPGSTPKGAAGDTGPKMPPARKPKKNQE